MTLCTLNPVVHLKSLGDSSTYIFLSTAVLPYFDVFYFTNFVIGSNSTFSGCYIVTKLTALTQLLGVEQFGKTYSLLLFSGAIGQLVSLPFVGKKNFVRML